MIEKNSIKDNIEFVKLAKEIVKRHNKRFENVCKMGYKLDELIAMSQNTDPYWMTQSKVLKAIWASTVTKHVIEPFLKSQGIKNMHLRDVHYTLTSGDYKTWDGETYLNTVKCWGELLHAFSVARYLGLVDYTLIRDNKNFFNKKTFYIIPKELTKIITETRDSITPEKIIEEMILINFHNLINPWYYQPCHIEIFLEKDLALVEKIASEYAINTTIGEGETSVTMIYQLADRIIEANKPTRICYISDCDVVGTNMVKSMSRKLEYVLETKIGRNELDVKVINLMLTPEQVKKYHLPTIPMKESKSKGYETRKEKWMEKRTMDGAVEINTLHAKYPDVFKEILQNFIISYMDITQWNKAIDIQKNFREKLKLEFKEHQFNTLFLLNIFNEIGWENLTKDFDSKVKKLKDYLFNVNEEDSFFKWLLDTKKNYTEQLQLYENYENVLGDNEDSENAYGENDE